jgi:hypothetical protein
LRNICVQMLGNERNQKNLTDEISKMLKCSIPKEMIDEIVREIVK